VPPNEPVRTRQHEPGPARPPVGLTSGPRRATPWSAARPRHHWGVRSPHNVDAYARDLLVFCRSCTIRQGGRTIWRADSADLRALKTARRRVDGFRGGGVDLESVLGRSGWISSLQSHAGGVDPSTTVDCSARPWIADHVISAVERRSRRSKGVRRRGWPRRWRRGG
jgi:hypothetical protein